MAIENGEHRVTVHPAGGPTASVSVIIYVSKFKMVQNKEWTP